MFKLTTCHGISKLYEVARERRLVLTRNSLSRVCKLLRVHTEMQRTQLIKLDFMEIATFNV